MNYKKVKELMLPIDDYATVDEDSSLQDAVITLDEAQARVPQGLQPYREVLVVNKQGKIIGKLGHLSFLRALEPKYDLVGDLPTISRAGLSSSFITSMIENLRLWQTDLLDVCRQAKNVRVKDVMHPVTENIDEDATISEAIHKMIMWQTLSILVTREDELVGILRLSDLYNEIANIIKTRS